MNALIQFLHLEALERAKGGLQEASQKLRNLLELDFEKAKADLEAGMVHFSSEITRLRNAIDPDVLAHIDDGQHPQNAVAMAQTEQAAANEPMLIV